MRLDRLLSRKAKRIVMAIVILAVILIVRDFLHGANRYPENTGNSESTRQTESYNRENLESSVDLKSGTVSEDDFTWTDADGNVYDLVGYPVEFDYASVPEWDGITPYVAVNDSVPFFNEGQLMNTESFEFYSELDDNGRCGVAAACIGQDLMPTEERGNISSIKPTGWHSIKMDFVDGGYLYNRCHLIGFQLCGENANWKNLITGTRYLNIDGMVGFENMVADYVRETGNHVMYRITPIFIGEEDVARGLLMEAWSVEDGGEGICYCVYSYNNQPGVEIDYETGEALEIN